MELSNEQNEKIGMFNRRLTFINEDENHTLLFGNDVVKAKINAIAANRVLLKKAVEQKLVDSTGDGPQKQKTKSKAIKTLGNKCRSCGVYFEDNNAEDIAKQLNRPKSYYDKQSDEDIAGVMAIRRKILWDNSRPVTAPYLIPYGVNDAFFEKLDDEIKEMVKWLPKPGAALQSQYAGDVEINKYIGLIDKQQDQLDRLVIDAFEEEHSDFVSEFLKTGNQISVGVRHNKVFTSMKNEAGQPINLGEIRIINPANDKVLHKLIMDAEGKEEFNCMNKNLYADASAPDFVSQRKLFKPEYRGSFNLDFVMVAV